MRAHRHSAPTLFRAPPPAWARIGRGSGSGLCSLKQPLRPFTALVVHSLQRPFHIRRSSVSGRHASSLPFRLARCLCSVVLPWTRSPRQNRPLRPPCRVKPIPSFICPRHVPFAIEYLLEGLQFGTCLDDVLYNQVKFAHVVSMP